MDDNQMENKKDGSGTKQHPHGKVLHLFPLQHWQSIALLLVAFDCVVVNLAYIVGLWIRFDMRYSMIPQTYKAAWLKFAPYYTVFCIVVFYLFRLYNSIWRFASYTELVRIMAASCVTTPTISSGHSCSSWPFWPYGSPIGSRSWCARSTRTARTRLAGSC